MGPTWQHRNRHLHFLNDLPVEMIAEILAALKLNKRALSACTLVSHMWRDLARPLLFRTIHFTVIPAQMATLRRITQDHPILASFIQSLSLSSRGLSYGDNDYSHHLDLGELLSLLHGLPSLQHLTLSWVYIFDTTPRVELPFAPTFRIKSLHVYYVWPINEENQIFPLTRLLCWIKPDILHYENPLDIEVFPSHRVDLVKHPISQYGLSLKTMYGNTQLCSLRTFLCLDDIRMLQIELHRWADAEALFTFLHNGACNVTHITLDFTNFFWYYPREMETPPLKVFARALAACQHLDSLRIQLEAYETSGNYAYVYHNPILTTLVPMSIRHLIIFLVYLGSYHLNDETPDRDMYDLHQLDTHLTLERFPRLERVTVEIEVFHRRDATLIRAAVEKALPTLRAAPRPEFAVVTYTNNV